MSNLLMLERRVSRLEKLLKNEAKQVGTLYHVCTADAYLDYIEPTDTLQASGNYTNWLYGNSNKYVSFTRDKHFAVKTSKNLSAGIIIQLAIDGDLLSNNKKILPYNDFHWTGGDNDGYYDTPDISYDEDPTQREMEEVVKGPIRNISKYIKEKYFDFIAFTPDSIELLKQLIGKGFKFNFITYKINDKKLDAYKKKYLKKGDSPEKVISIMEKYLNYLKDSPTELDISNVAALRYQLDQGVRPSKDTDWKFIFDYNVTDIVAKLLRNGLANEVELSEMLEYALNHSSTDIIKTLLKYGADPNEKFSNGESPLYNELTSSVFPGGRVGVVKELVKYGADTDEVLDTGESIRDFALSIGAKPGVIKLLS